MTQDAAPIASVPTARISTAPAPRRWVVLATVGVVVLASALAYWAHARHFEDTDDAQVDGDISNVSPRVSGHLSSVKVVENQLVKAGQVLAVIDPTDLQLALDQARAQVAEAQAQLGADDPSVPITVSSNQSALATARSDLAAARAGLSAARKDVEQIRFQLAQAEANDKTARVELERSDRLAAEGVVTQSDHDLHVNSAAASAASVDALQRALAAAQDRALQQQAQIAAIESRLGEIQSNAPRHVAARQAVASLRQAALDLAQAQLAQAEKNVSYTNIVAPVSGVVAKKSAAVGDHVMPGQVIFAISQSDALWVTANFRETQLRWMQPDQPARLHVDALDLDLRGTVESVGGATGSRLSVFPPENASGNYVKVVQRIPVRIRLEPGQAGAERLRIGMSVEPTVTVR
ncbi:MAG: HlyD family secretion protein [Polyangiaceae bacterium]